MFRTILSRPSFDENGLARLGTRWRELAARSGASYFQDWGWVGCMASQRYPDPVLLEVTRHDALIALALFNRKPSLRESGAWHLQEATDPSLKSIFVEHNGPLVAIVDPVLRQAVLADLFGQAMRGVVDGATLRPRRLVLSGVGPDSADALAMTGGVIDEKAVRTAPYVDFGAVSADRPFIDGLSRNSRHQLRRSNRLYAAHGAVGVRRAETVAEGLHFFHDMVALHDATWRARGKRGAFATEAVRRFYDVLLTDGIPRGEIDLLRIAAGDVVIGYLMNFTHGNVVSAYQSGFNYQAAAPHQKPGLTCHFYAIESYRARGFVEYDFLAGADRYKLSLANAERSLHWLSAAPTWHPSSIGARLRHMLQVSL